MVGGTVAILLRVRKGDRGGGAVRCVVDLTTYSKKKEWKRYNEVERERVTID